MPTATGLTNGATVVTMVPAPRKGTRRLIPLVSIYNADTASATPIIRIDDSGNTRTIKRNSNVATDDTVSWTDELELDPDQKLEIVLAGTVTTNELIWYVRWHDQAQYVGKP